MSDARPLVIVNPQAGARACGRTLGVLVPAVERALGPVDVVQTERPGHAIELARQGAGEGRLRILAAGGDGTVHEVANGILAAQQAEGSEADAASETTLGVLGRGTGGDFGRTLGIRDELEGIHGYLGAIARGRVRALDVGRVKYDDADGAHERFFVNILSTGLSGLVVRRMATANRALGAGITYYNTSVRALFQARRAHVRVRYLPARIGGESHADDFHERTFPSYLVAICNGRYFGAGMHVAPMADPADGRLEVVSIDAPDKLGFFLNARRIRTAGHLGRPGVTHFSCRQLHLELALDEKGSPGPPDLRERFVNDVDGEALGGLPLEVHLVPQALRVFA